MAVLAEGALLEVYGCGAPVPALAPQLRALTRGAAIGSCTTRLFAMGCTNPLVAVCCKLWFLSSTRFPLQIALVSSAARNGKVIGFQKTSVLEQQDKMFVETALYGQLTALTGSPAQFIHLPWEGRNIGLSRTACLSPCVALNNQGDWDNCAH